MVFYFEIKCELTDKGTNEETELNLPADLMTFTKFIDQEVTRMSQVINRIYILW